VFGDSSGHGIQAGAVYHAVTFCFENHAFELRFSCVQSWKMLQYRCKKAKLRPKNSKGNTCRRYTRAAIDWRISLFSRSTCIDADQLPGTTSKCRHLGQFAIIPGLRIEAGAPSAEL